MDAAKIDLTSGGVLALDPVKTIAVIDDQVVSG